MCSVFELLFSTYLSTFVTFITTQTNHIIFGCIYIQAAYINM